MPYCFPCGCFDSIRHQVGGDLPDAVSQQKPGEDAPDNGSLLRVDLRLAIRTPAVSTITEHLEQIKENQYTLYYEIQNANRNSESMLSSIGDDVKFSAYQNAATAKNVETMRYISMMKNVWNGKGF